MPNLKKKRTKKGHWRNPPMPKAFSTGYMFLVLILISVKVKALAEAGNRFLTGIGDSIYSVIVVLVILKLLTFKFRYSK